MFNIVYNRSQQSLNEQYLSIVVFHDNYRSNQVRLKINKQVFLRPLF